MEKFAWQIMYTCFVVCFVVKETSVVGILDDETCIYAICRSEFLNFRGLNASIFVFFFFNRPKIL